jgi:pimeloyl-ACP methyl ester carboxylesterase
MSRPVRVVLLCVLALFVAAPAEAKVPKAPGGLALYKPPKKLGGYTHGDLIWGRKVKSPLKEGSRAWVVLYRSTSVNGKAVGESGTVILPKGKPPKGGWPLISWAHGTSGIADQCAPSRDPEGPYTAYVAPQENYWLKQGYALASTDYEGLGTPGVHPYLVGRSAGRSVLDIARASREVDSRIGRKLVISGHSQGGHAALWAAALAPKWTPELKFRGVAAFAPASHLDVLADALPGFTTPSGGLSALAGMVVTGLAAAYPQLDPQKFVSDEALALLPQTKTKCLGELGMADSLGGLPASHLTRPGADLSVLHKLLVANNPNLKIKAPVLILQGESDTTVYPFLTNRLDTELRARGDKVTYAKYPGATHVSVVAAGDARMRAFLKARLG